MYSDFIEALNNKFNCSGESELSGSELQHYHFAATTRKRAADAVAVFEAYGYNMNGLKVLDIGCAYGGFSIEAAHKGADAYGIEISEQLYGYACLNNKDEVYTNGSCHFVLADAASADFADKIPENFFDLIIVNDVFEHVYDTVKLVKNLSKAANESGAIYYVIPNGDCFRWLPHEGHNGLCGLSIMPPLMWSALTEKIYNIYYRQYEHYLAIFSLFGFNNVTELNFPGYILEDDFKLMLESGYKKAMEGIDEQESSLPERYGKELKTALCSYEKQLEYDKAHINIAEMTWKYMTDFWSGFAHRNKPQLSPLMQTSLKRTFSDDLPNVDFILSRNGNKLTLTVKTGQEYSDCLIDLRLRMLRQSRSISWTDYMPYSSTVSKEWILKSAGMYCGAIYIKDKDGNERRINTQPLYYQG